MRNTLLNKIRAMSTEQLLAAVYQDPLTGLLNRRAFNEVGEPSGLYVAIVDADSLKWVNDTMGYRVGDTHLCSIAQALVETFDTENVYRIAGDEFVVTFAEPFWAKALLELIRVASPGFSYGIGRTLPQANQSLKLDKERRTKLGLRVDRGDAPYWAGKLEKV